MYRSHRGFPSWCLLHWFAFSITYVYIIKLTKSLDDAEVERLILDMPHVNWSRQRTKTSVGHTYCNQSGPQRFKCPPQSGLIDFRGFPKVPDWYLGVHAGVRVPGSGHDAQVLPYLYFIGISHWGVRLGARGGGGEAGRDRWTGRDACKTY